MAVGGGEVGCVRVAVAASGVAVCGVTVHAARGLDSKIVRKKIIDRNRLIIFIP